MLFYYCRFNAEHVLHSRGWRGGGREGERGQSEGRRRSKDMTLLSPLSVSPAPTTPISPPPPPSALLVLLMHVNFQQFCLFVCLFASVSAQMVAADDGVPFWTGWRTSWTSVARTDTTAVGCFFCLFCFLGGGGERGK